MPNKRTIPDEQIVIIIGDWYFDENWIISPQKHYYSSHTGEAHYKARLEEGDQGFMSFGGGAALMQMLRCAFKREDKYKIVGFGAWNPTDKYSIKCVFCSKDHPDKGRSQNTLTGYRPMTEKESNSKFCVYTGHAEQYKRRICNNIPYRCEFRNLTDDKETKVCTNKVMRYYEGYEGGTLKLKYRLDYLTKDPKIDWNSWDSFIDSVNIASIKAVIIEDHGLGVINNTAATKVAELLSGSKAKNAKLFVRTKIENPYWMDQFKEKLGNIPITLVVYDHQLAKRIQGERKWYYEKTLGRSALELLGRMTGTEQFGRPELNINTPKAKNAAVLLDENIVFGMNNEQCFLTYRSTLRKLPTNIGRTTTFFAGLIYQSINNTDNRQFEDQCYHSLRCAYDWSKNASKARNMRLGRNFYGDYEMALDNLKGTIKQQAEITSMGDYMNLWNEWSASSEKQGVITKEVEVKEVRGKENEKEKKRIIQLWRGIGTIPKFICVGGPKRDGLNNLANKIAEFKKQGNPKYPLSCLLTGSPGWGKSFLAECLARKFGFTYMDYSVAQMATTTDFVNCLATISSVQNRTGDGLLIFIDEVNSHIEGNPIINLLLGPLWGGVFFYEGKSYRLEPAVWVFASTRGISDFAGGGGTDSDGKVNKGSDFVSRLNGPVIQLDSLGGQKNSEIAVEGLRIEVGSADITDLKRYRHVCSAKSSDSNYKNYRSIKDAQIKTEQVYLMINMLSRIWGSIIKVHEDVLELFHDMFTINGIRSMELFASRFEDINDDTLVGVNVPDLALQKNEELRRHIILPEDWLGDNGKRKPLTPEKAKAEKFIQIET